MPDSTGRPYHFERDAQTPPEPVLSAPVAVPPPDTPQAQIAPPSAPESPKKGNRQGFNGGGHRPKGIHTPLRTKKVYNIEQLADAAASAVIIGKGRGLQKSPLLGPVTSNDRETIKRITGESVEVFNEHMASRLRLIADKAASRIEEKLDNNEFKSGELGFILSVAHDKRLSLDGSRALNNSSVNIQVNNFGPTPKDSLLSELDGLGSVKQVSPIAV
jgi:hypothetical protein